MGRPQASGPWEGAAAAVLDAPRVIDHGAFPPSAELDADAIVAAHELYAMLTGLWAPAIIEAAHDIGIFEHLTPGPIGCSALARAVSTDRAATRVLLDGLHAYGIVDRSVVDGEVGYRLRDRYAPSLLAGGTYSLTGKIRHDRDIAWSAWRRLADTVRSGTGDSDGNQRQNTISEGDYVSLARGISFWAPPVVECLRARLADLGWSTDGPARVLDVGCGTGLYSQLLLQAAPMWTAVGLEKPKVSALARRQADELGVSERFTCLDVDFLDHEWGRDHDIVLFANIFHLQPPALAEHLVHRGAEALRPGGCLAVIDNVLSDDSPTIDGPQDRFAALFAVSMLSTGGGDSYRRSDFEGWMRGAGLRVVGQYDTPMHRVLFARGDGDE